MNKKFYLLIICFFVSNLAFSWGRVGHDAITSIAENNLRPRTKKIIEKYLKHSIVYYSCWMDDYRATPTYKHTTYWHTAPVDSNLEYTDKLNSSKGNVISALENAIKILKNYKNYNDSTVIVNIKYVIHTVADMHCPSHIKYPDIKTNYDIFIKGKKYAYHSVWDSQIIEQSHRWYYSEWQKQLDRLSNKQKKEICKGSPKEWFHNSAIDCKIIYKWAPANSSQTIDFINLAQGLSEAQMIKAGYRLAKILNELF